MIHVSKYFPQEVADLLNSYPAFAESDEEHGIMVESFFQTAMQRGVLETGCEASRRYRRCILAKAGLYDGVTRPFTKEEAIELLVWLEPKWCKWKQIETSGFNFADLDPIGESVSYLSDDMSVI